jgi:hypothetical protein
MSVRFVPLARFAIPFLIAAAQGNATGLAADKLVQMNCGARIECITPDGQAGRVAKLGEAGAVTAQISSDDTVTCLLQEGRTDFVVELPKAGTLDRLTFVNENSLARGELKIAVSDERLRADSKGWVEVEGIVPFSHKRLFGVSLIGIEAKFVRLSFQVEKEGRIGTLKSSQDNVAGMTPATAEKEEPFSEAALQPAMDSRFAIEHGRDRLLLTANASSVQPLSPGAR